MDTDVIKAKLVSLQRCMERIRQKTPANAQQLAEDFDLQDILILNLQRAVQISIDIATSILADSPAVPSTMAEAFLLLHRQGGTLRGCGAQTRQERWPAQYRSARIHQSGLECGLRRGAYAH